MRKPPSSRFDYRPGAWPTIVAGRRVCVCPPDSDPRLLDQLWSILANGGTTVDALRLLTGDLTARTPDIALLDASGDRLRVIVGGAVIAVVDGERVDAAEAITWVERVLPLPREAILCPPGHAESEPGEGSGTPRQASPADQRNLPIGAGVVLAASIRFDGTVNESEAAPALLRSTDDDVDFDPAGVRPGVAVDVPLPTADAGESPPTSGGSDPDESTRTADDVSGGAASEDTIAGELTRDSRPAMVEDPPMAAGSPTTDIPVEDDDYDFLFGRTVARHVEDAARRPVDESDDDSAESVDQPTDADTNGSSPMVSEAGSGVPADPASVASGPGPVASQIDPAPAAARRQASIIDAVPLAPGSPSTTGSTGPQDPGTIGVAPPDGLSADLGFAHGAPAAPAPTLGDHDGATVTSAEAAALRSPAPTVPTAHPAYPVQPILRLVLSTGKVVDLSTPVIVGRAPRAVRVAQHDAPQLVPVPSPQQDISRNHLAVRREGESVLVTDLGTTNGTFLGRAGADPHRLHPHEPVVLEPGTIVSVGDGVTCWLEVDR